MKGIFYIGRGSISKGADATTSKVAVGSRSRRTSGTITALILGSERSPRATAPRLTQVRLEKEQVTEVKGHRCKSECGTPPGSVAADSRFLVQEGGLQLDADVTEFSQRRAATSCLHRELRFTSAFDISCSWAGRRSSITRLSQRSI